MRHRWILESVLAIAGRWSWQPSGWSTDSVADCRCRPTSPAADSAAAENANQGWFPFDPKSGPFTGNSAIDLRFLNERFAGEHGFIGVKAGQFIRTDDGKPSIISETTWNRLNRFRSEAPLYYAAYGALQASDAIVHFALDGAAWSVKPRYFMQPWTLMSPAMMGQFPAAALIFRRSSSHPAGWWLPST